MNSPPRRGDAAAPWTGATASDQTGKSGHDENSTPPQTAKYVAASITAEHEAAQAAARDAVAHAICAGELLIEAKAALKHGEFGAWLAANVTFSERTARGYMRLAGLDEAKRQRVANMSLRGALRALATPVAASNDDLAEVSRDEFMAMSTEDLDRYRRCSLEVAANHFQAILDCRDAPSDAAGMAHAKECVADAKRLLIDIAARSPAEQKPLAMMIVTQLIRVNEMLARGTS